MALFFLSVTFPLLITETQKDLVYRQISARGILRKKKNENISTFAGAGSHQSAQAPHARSAPPSPTAPLRPVAAGLAGKWATRRPDERRIRALGTQRRERGAWQKARVLRLHLNNGAFACDARIEMHA